MTYLLQLENQYQRFQWTPLKAGRLGQLKNLIDTQKYNTILVNETYFDYYSYTIALTSPTIFTVKDLKVVIQQKMKLVREKYGRVHIVYHYLIQGCMHEYTPVNHVLWKSWNLSFILRVMVLKHLHVLELKKYLPVSQLKIIPKHLGLIQRLNTVMTWRFTVLNFGDCEVACIASQWWWFTAMSCIPFGLSLLRECFKEHEIAPYLYNDIERIEKNTLLRKTVEEVFTFFLTQLVARMHQHAVLGSPCVLICPFATHSVFLEVIETLSASYQETVFVPFSGQLIQEDGSNIDMLLVQSRIHKTTHQKKKQ